VLDTHAADLVVVRDAELAGELPYDLGLLGRLDVLVRRVVVRDQSDLVRIEHGVDADLAELADGDRGGDVVGEHQVEVALDELARHDPVQARVSGQQLLGDRHGTGHRVRPFATLR